MMIAFNQFFVIIFLYNISEAIINRSQSNMLKLTKRILMQKTFKNKLAQKVTEFLTVDAGATIRNTPTTKQRKYKNVEITEDFKRIDDKRKKQRFENMRKRQLLLQNQLKNEEKLLSGPQAQLIKTQLATIQQNIINTQKQIQQLTNLIDSSQADFMVVEGHMKLSVINHIKYLKYIHDHNPGFTLHPETIKAMQNVHYCVNHNLPIKRINLYEIMPDLFESQIQQLQESVIKLIQQKQIDFAHEDTASSIRFFHRVNHPILLRSRDDELGEIQQERQRVVINMFNHCHRMIDKHHQFLYKVDTGKTPFRGIQHMIYVMMSDMPIKYLPEEQEFRKVVMKISQIGKEWENYTKSIDKKLDQLQFKYIKPPLYIKNHPLLAAAYEGLMKQYTSPKKMEQSVFAINGDLTQAKLAQKMEEQIRTIVKQKYDPLFIEAMNNDRSKIDNKKLEIQFYNLSTNILQEINLLTESSPQQEIFKQLPKKPSLLSAQRKKNLITLDQLTRMLFLNNKDKNKYNLQFFSKWFGVEIEQLKNLLKYISYMRVPIQTEKTQQSDLKTEILRFQT